MLDKKFDEHIKALFEDHQVPLEPGHWDQFEEQLESVIGEETSFIDDDVIEQLKNYEALPIAGDWEVMASLLDKAEAQANENFDQDIKDSVDHYEAPYDRSSWPILEQKLTFAEMRRRNVLIAKVLEVAAVILFLFTLYNFYPEIKTKVFKPAQELKTDRSLYTRSTNSEKTLAEKQIAGLVNDELPSLNGLSSNDQSSQIPGSGENTFSSTNENLKSPGQIETATNDNLIQARNLNSDNIVREKRISEPIYSQAKTITEDQQTLERDQSPVLITDLINGKSNISFKVIPDGVSDKENINETTQPSFAFDRDSESPLDPLEGLSGHLHIPIFQNDVHQKLYGQFTPPKRKIVETRVGIHAGTDINILHFPEDNFFSAGNRISFKAQDLPAVGYGGGLSLGWYGHRFGFESGLHYSNKSFKPGRQLLIGESLENSKVDFQAVEIDLVSIPLSLSYKIKPSGTFRFYVVGGLDFNIIAQAHYDLKIQNNYPFPLSITQSASSLASNREAHRVKEHILDGAKFNSKSFVTAHAGIGIEKYLNPELSIFLQPSYLYQIPIDRFSNNIGKHFKTLNIRIGTRLPLK
jgi:hypothetical protein